MRAFRTDEVVNFMFLLLVLIVCLVPGVILAADPVPIILDTDMAGDCDDAGALAVLNELANRNEAKILAIVTNRRDGKGVSAAACDAINTYYGRPDVPIGTDKNGVKVRWGRQSPFTPALASDFPHDTPVDAKCRDALDVYRSTLAAAEDGTVIICSVGALSNLEDLLNSKADSHSELAGPALIEKKVKRLVVMGGEFPRSSRPETNLRLDPSAAVTVTNNWPGVIFWQGYEVGAALHCGKSLQSCSKDNPVRRAFELRPYLGAAAITHGKPAHDQAAVLFAVRNFEVPDWKVSEPGRAVIDSDGHSDWKPDPKGRHAYLSIKGRPDRLAALIDELMAPGGELQND